jgi:ankyrin repeat protein
VKRIVLVIVFAIAVVAPFLAETQKDSLATLIQKGNTKAALATIQGGGNVNDLQPDGTSALHWAVSRGDAELVQALLAKGAKADVANEFGSTPLLEAAKLPDAKIVKMLLDAGAKVDSANLDGETALMVAINRADLASVEMLIAKGANVNNVEKFHNQTPLMYASASDRYGAEMVKALLAKGADVKPRALYSDWPSQVTSEPRTQYRSTGGLNALLYAARGGCYYCVEQLIAAGANVNLPTPEGVTPLMTALDNSHNDIAKLLLDKGANPHVWDWWGRTAIYIAVDRKPAAGGAAPLGGFAGGPGAGKGGPGAGKGGPGRGAGQGSAEGANRSGPAVSSLEMINILLDAGVDPNHEMNFHRPNAPARGRFQDNQLSTGTTALFRAVQLNDEESVKALLAKGANPDINSMGFSAFLLAAGVTPGGRGGGGGQINMALLDMIAQHSTNLNAKVTGTKTYSYNVSRAASSNEGTTALHEAARAARTDVVKFLLDHGANPNVVDADGKKPIDVVGVARQGGGPGGAPAAAAAAPAEGQAKGKGAPGGPGGGNRGGANPAAVAEVRSLLEKAAAKN